MSTRHLNQIRASLHFRLRALATSPQETSLSPPSPPDQKKDPKAAKVNEIIAAALEEFFLQGFAAARLDAIAERAGIGKGTIYLYFDSKEALFEAAVRSIVAPILEQAERLAISPQGSAADMLRMMIRTFYEQIVATERRRILRLLIAEGPRFPRLVSFYHREVVSRGMMGLRGILRYGVQRGEFRADLPVDYPQVIVGPALVGAVWHLLFADLETLDIGGLCDAHLDIILNGLIDRNTPASRGTL